MQQPQDLFPPRFAAKIAVNPATGCWEWQGAIQSKGYGSTDLHLADGRRLSLAHHAAYVYATGQTVLPSCVLMHECDNRRCVNPAHLKAGSHADNRADAVRKGRHAHGTRHPKAKLTPAVIAAARERRALGGVSIAHLARVCGVSGHTLADALAGRTWADSEAA
jgi:hypothetical protein